MELCVSVDWKRQRLCLHEPLRGVIRWRITSGTWTVEGENMAVTLRASTDQVSASLVIKDANGNPAVVDGVPIWEVSDAEIIAVTVAPDGMSAVIAAQSKPGLAQVTVTVDADLGEGVKPIIGIGEVEVVGGEATVVELQFGPVEPIPPA